jgi:hypothetical protein
MSVTSAPRELELDRTDRPIERDFDTAAVYAGVFSLELALCDEQPLSQIDLAVDALDGDLKITEIALVSTCEVNDSGAILAEAFEEILDLSCTGHARTLSGVTR